ncbi:nitroreductase family protein [Anaeromusa acidaminophila]|uniref:nitroreductase family protein n=1 Tax=Anaeromusa acidaminophila TaxID=81464 RepID=UPI00037A03A0|nr:nitroreductase family protein [Anaeromusa acidaminophila]
MIRDFWQAVKGRRTYYSLAKESPISEERLRSIIENAVLHTPTAFNSQSGRVLVVTGEQQNALWDIVEAALRKIVPADSFGPTEEKIAAFRKAYGSVLFFEDQTVVKGLQERFPLYQENFPIWSQHASGMLQFVVWTALEEAGFGASLQHYGSLIEDEVRQRWSLPESWSLIAQMPFGKPSAQPNEKEFQPLDGRVRFSS